MLHTRCLAAILVAGWLAGVAPAADFAALVGQLAADDYQTRERAGAALLKAGESAIPDLKTALLKVTDPEANRRLQVLLERLESDCLAEPRRVTLKVERKPAKEVFVELARQSGYQFSFDANPNRDKALVTFDWAGTPFLQAVDQLCDVLQMNSIVNEHDGAVSVYDGDQVNPHVAYAGPFRIVATQIHSNRSLQVGGFSRRNPLARAPDSVNVNFSVQGEPKACLCALGPTTVLRATDESKNSLLLAEPAAPAGDDAPAGTPGGDLPPPTFRSHSSDTWFAVSRGTRRSEFVKECRVRLTVAVLAEARPEVTVADVAKSAGAKFTGRTHLLEVGPTGVQGNAATVKVTVRRKQPDPSDDYSWINSLAQRFEAFDAEGRPLRNNGVSEQNNTPDAVTMTLNFSRPAGAKIGVVAKLNLVEWVVQHKTIEFTLKDLPLP